MQNMMLAVSAPPFWHCGRTFAGSMRWMLLALAPAVIMAIINWGLPAVRVMAMAVSTAVLVEAVACKMMRRTIYVDNLNAVLIGLLFSFLLPAAVPWWLVMLGSALSILLGKMVFGGVGGSPLCAPLVGWAVLFLSWPTLMDPNLAELNTTFVDPLARMHLFGIEAVDISTLDLLFGHQTGALGASQTGALLLGGIFLCLIRVIRWEIAASFLVGIAATAAVFSMITPDMYPTPIFQIMTGSTILGAFFLATDYSSSPNRPVPMLLYGLLAGMMVIFIRSFGVYTDGVPFAILLISLISPQLELIRPKPFGAR